LNGGGAISSSCRNLLVVVLRGQGTEVGTGEILASDILGFTAKDFSEREPPSDLGLLFLALFASRVIFKSGN
jgi:hypothetical protein